MSIRNAICETRGTVNDLGIYRNVYSPVRDRLPRTHSKYWYGPRSTRVRLSNLAAYKPMLRPVQNLRSNFDKITVVLAHYRRQDYNFRVVRIGTAPNGRTLQFDAGYSECRLNFDREPRFYCRSGDSEWKYLVHAEQHYGMRVIAPHSTFMAKKGKG